MKKYFSILFLIGISVSQISEAKSMQESKGEYSSGETFKPDLSLFMQSGRICLSLEDIIPQECKNRDVLVEDLKMAQLTLVKTDAQVGVKRDVGYTFPTTAPWCLLVAKHISLLSFRPNLGDWGCGHGFFSRLALVSGANPYAIDSSKPAAEEANKLLWGTRTYLPEGLNIKDLYKASCASVVKPGSKFMDRRNHINVSFNVIHHLCPKDIDLFLGNMFKNTIEGGLVFLSADTPFGPLDGRDVCLKYYREGVKLKLKYPGYGVYSVSNIVFMDDKSKGRIDRQVYRPTKTEEDSQKFKMGVQYKGICPVLSEFDALDNGQTLSIAVGDPVDLSLNILHQSDRPYAFATGHQAKTVFDFSGLKAVMESAGFSVINGWYTDHDSSTLYPIDDKGLDGIRKAKVVIVAQKSH